MDEAVASALAPANPWLLKYLDFAETLAATGATGGSSAGTPLRVQLHAPALHIAVSPGRHGTLVMRGSFSAGDLLQLMGELDHRGLFLLIMVKDQAEVERLRPHPGF